MGLSLPLLRSLCSGGLIGVPLSNKTRDVGTVSSQSYEKAVGTYYAGAYITI
jgi:hypothetical protein